MKVLGIVAEYNPFHNGHLYHLQKSREMTGADFVVAVMSGNFVERGDAAVSAKWTRAQIAIECGADLVLELPFAYACNNAEYFARGAVGILDGLGCVTDMVFGSETADIEALKVAAQFLAAETAEFKDALRDALGRGLSFPAARAWAFAKSFENFSGKPAKDISLSSLPNDILAIEYLKQLCLLKSHIEPHALLRQGEGYDSKNIKSPLASAAAIREILKNGGELSELELCMPKPSRLSLEKDFELYKIRQRRLFELVRSRILTADEQELSRVFSAAEGLENRMKQAARSAHDIEELAMTIKSRRYTLTRIRRLLIHTLMGFDKEAAERIFGGNLLYARVLAFNAQGAELLRHIKKAECADIPIVTNINKQVPSAHRLRDLLEFDIRATDIYNIISGADTYKSSDFVEKPRRADAAMFPQ